MSIQVRPPIIQTLGMQGEHLLVKVIFPMLEVRDDPEIDEMAEQEVIRDAGRRAIILRMKAEDLPIIHPRGETPLFNIGDEIRERLGGD